MRQTFCVFVFFFPNDTRCPRDRWKDGGGISLTPFDNLGALNKVPAYLILLVFWHKMLSVGTGEVIKYDQVHSCWQGDLVKFDPKTQLPRTSQTVLCTGPTAVCVCH